MCLRTDILFRAGATYVDVAPTELRSQSGRGATNMPLLTELKLLLHPPLPPPSEATTWASRKISCRALTLLTYPLSFQYARNGASRNILHRRDDGADPHPEFRLRLFFREAI